MIDAPEMKTAWQIERAMTSLNVTAALWEPWVSDIKKKDAAIAELVEGLLWLLKAYEALCEEEGYDFHLQEATRAAHARALITKYGDKT